MKVAWVSTWDRVCGIADYSKDLWPEINKTLMERGDQGILVSLDKFKSEDLLIKELKNISPDIVHIQHEYGIFGGKNPPFYTFPGIVDHIRAELPQIKILATAHTVILDDYRFPLRGKRWQLPFRAMANIFLLKRLKKLWGPGTWGLLNGTITHSRRQLELVKRAGTRYAEVIPHFVPLKEKAPLASNGKDKTVLIFGFFTYDKGQDIAIQAFDNLRDLPQVHLILAGGLRKKSDTKYFNECNKKIKDLNLSDRIKITGYLEGTELKKYYDQADLVVAPFRATTGSGSLVQGLGRGLPVLASDLPLNLELNERVPGTLEYFKSENPKDLAQKIRDLIFDQPKLNLMRQGALRYAVSFSLHRVVSQHVMVYDNLVK